MTVLPGRCDGLDLQVQQRQAAISRELESSGGDMERMQALLDELDKLNAKVRRIVTLP